MDVVQLIKDYTAEHARVEVEFYMGMVEDQQSFQDIIDHLTSTCQSGKTDNSLTAEHFSQTQNIKEMEDAFVDDLQVLVHKIIAHKPSFWLKAYRTLKHQYAQHLWNPIMQLLADSS